MPYRNAAGILPDSLLKEIQKYVQGEQIYIPRREDQKIRWGMKNGTRAMIHERNRKIRARKKKGEPVEKLADDFHLSLDTIRKIVYGSKESP